MLALALAGVAVGFAAYVYLLPYQKLVGAISSRNDQLETQKSAAQAAEAARDKLKEELDRRQEEASTQQLATEKHKAALAGLTEALKPALEPLRAQASSDGSRVKITLATKVLFDGTYTATVSSDGAGALRVILGVLAKARPKTVTVRAPLSVAPPPRELQQFRNLGEFTMLRSARVALALTENGLGADHVAVVGQAVPAPTGRRPKPGSPPEIVDLLVDLD